MPRSPLSPSIKTSIYGRMDREDFEVSDNEVAQKLASYVTP